MRTPRRRLLALATVAGVVAALATPVAAQAAGWDLNGSGGGVAGAHAFGTAVKKAGGRLQFDATLKDTDPNDGKFAVLKLIFYPLAHSGSDKELTAAYATGPSKFSREFVNLGKITAIECVRRGVDHATDEHCGANVVTIWSS